MPRKLTMFALYNVGQEAGLLHTDKKEGTAYFMNTVGSRRQAYIDRCSKHGWEGQKEIYEG